MILKDISLSVVTQISCFVIEKSHNSQSYWSQLGVMSWGSLPKMESISTKWQLKLEKKELHNVVSQLYFKNKIINSEKKKIRFAVTRNEDVELEEGKSKIKNLND